VATQKKNGRLPQKLVYTSAHKSSPGINRDLLHPSEDGEGPPVNRNQSIFRRTLPAIGLLVLATVVFAAVTWQESANASANSVVEPLVTPTVTPNPSPTCGVPTVMYFSYIHENLEPIIVADRQTNEPGSTPGLGSLYPSIAPAPTPADGPAPESCIFYPPKVTFTLQSERPDDLDILLVDPNGNRSIVISDGGGSTPMNHVEYTIGAPSGPGTFPDETFPPAGFYTAANYPGLATVEPGGQDNFPGVGGLTNYPTEFTSLHSWAAGGWKLYVVDDETGSVSSLPNGWSIRIDGECWTPPTICPPSPTPTPSPPPSCGAGAPDRSFGDEGVVTTNLGLNDGILDIAFDSSGKITAAGNSGQDSAVARYHSDGSLDASFGNGGKVVIPVGNNIDYLTSVAIQPDGRIVTGGISHSGGTNHFTLIRFNSNGTLDPSFGTGGIVFTPTGTSSRIESIVLQPDGKIVAAGFSFNGSNSDFTVVRYRVDGTLDPTFGSGGRVITQIGSSDDHPYAAALQPDGRIVVAGRSTFSFLYNFAVVRYNSDGTLDNSFGVGGIATTAVGSGHAEIWSIALQPDGKIVAGGSVSNSSAGEVRFALARYSSTGSLDDSFGMGGVTTTEVGTYSRISDVELQSDGKIVVVGGATNGPTLNDFAVLRYEANGMLDPSFGEGGRVLTHVGQSDDATSCAIQNDGKIVVAGYNGSDFTMIRYHPADPCVAEPTPTPSPSPATPAPPTASAASNVLPNSFTANWSSSAGATGYRLDVSTSNTFVNFVPGFDNLDVGNVTSYSVTGLTGGIQYFYRVRAYNGAGTSGNSNVIGVVLPPACGYAISANQANFSANAGTGSVQVAAGPIQCCWGSMINNGTPPHWLTITSGSSGCGIGVVNYAVAANTTGLPRTKTMTIAGLTFTVNQSNTSPTRNRFDYDGDGRTDFSVFRSSSGVWYLQESTAGFRGVQFGAAGDKLAPADYDGDGKTDIAVFRSPSGAIWYRFLSATNTVDYSLFGVNGDLLAPGDYDGDGKADVTVFRPSDGKWYRRNSSNGSFFSMQFGMNGDVPTVGDFDGDGKNDIGVFRAAGGEWYNLRSSDGSVFAQQFGQSGDNIAPADYDYDGDGKTDIAIYRASSGLWVVRNSATGTYSYYVFGAVSDVPVPGDYDGDGKADIAVWRPSDGTWYVQRSSNGEFIVFPWGQDGDRPTPGAFGN